MTSPRPQTLAIIGLGLIGGSVARAVKASALPYRVHGAARNPETRRLAREAGAVDEAFPSAAEAALGADVVLLALPVLTIPEAVREIAPVLRPPAVLTDVGSTKLQLTLRVEELLPPGIAFVGGHPIAGTEDSGFDSSHDGLFRGARCILTPGARSTPEATAAVRALWEGVGSRVEFMDASSHDHILAVISHLPHLVAYALVGAAAAADREHRGLLEYTGGGFLDFTRIAASHPIMWRDICLDNREEILASLELFLKEASHLRDLVRERDGAGLEGAFDTARRVRRGLSATPPDD